MEKTAEIKFPVDWNYRIICDSSNQSCLDGLKAVLSKHHIDAPIKENKASAQGKYCSYTLEVIFKNREMMEELSNDLRQVDGVKFLL